MTRAGETGPIEVWLTQRNLTIKCMIVHNDETTTHVPVKPLNMRGAQRTITSALTGQGYTPAGRWRSEAKDAARTVESSRTFRLAVTS